MKKYDLKIHKNPLKTRDDLMEAFTQIINPLKPYFSEGCAHLHLGNTSSGYTDSIAEFEGFSRVLWGLAPFTAGGGESEFWDIYIQGIKNGTNPLHEEYWGKVHDYDQRLVEMASIGLALVLAPDKIWEPLNESEKKNFSQWISQINQCTACDCNWVLFAVIVNLGLKAVGENYDKEKINSALERIEEFYKGDGWYSDGENGHSDYYVPFAIHFYCLVYAKVMENEDSKRSELYKERAADFAKDFINWFSEDGSALPYGRSLAYRFAQSAFWSALAFAEVDVFTPGIIKGLVLRNLRWWFDKPIFNAEGILTIGYAYPNLLMAENYNSPGSPYWALKTFLILALDNEHPFWKAEEEELPKLDEVSIQEKPHLVICKNENSVMAFNSGHLSTNGHTHTSAKYEKFVYSNTFGFNVPRAEWGLEQGAFDSMLALSEEDNIYRVKRRCEEIDIKGNVIYSRWKPWSDVEIETRLICGNPWHIRIHTINTSRTIDTAEGGFALGLEQLDYSSVDCEFLDLKDGMFIKNLYGISGIINLYGVRKADKIWTNVNTNLLHSQTIIPTLIGKLKPGKHCFIVAVYGGSNKEELENIKKTIPYIEKCDDEICIFAGATKDKIFTMKLNK